MSGESWPTYRGRLADLLVLLQRRLATEERPRVQLPHGAVVGLQRRPTGQRVVRIYRPVAPVTEAQHRRWEAELRTFQHHLGLTGWTYAPLAVERGVAAAYLEPAPARELAG